MARLRSRLPWGILFQVALLFVIAWWVEDCFLYYIDWNQLFIVRLLETALAATHVNQFLAFFSQFVSDAAHGIVALIGKACSLIQLAYDTLPESWRARSVLRFIAWCGTTIVATFDSAAANDFWLGFKWFCRSCSKG